MTHDIFTQPPPTTLSGSSAQSPAGCVPHRWAVCGPLALQGAHGNAQQFRKLRLRQTGFLPRFDCGCQHNPGFAGFICFTDSSNSVARSRLASMARSLVMLSGLVFFEGAADILQSRRFRSMFFSQSCKRARWILIW